MITLKTESGKTVEMFHEGTMIVARIVEIGVEIKSPKFDKYTREISGYAKVGGKVTEIIIKPSAADKPAVASFFDADLAARKEAYKNSYQGHYDRVVREMNK